MRTVLVLWSCVALLCQARADDGIQLEASKAILLQHPSIVEDRDDNWPQCLAFVGGNKWLATGAVSGVLIWDVAKGKLHRSIKLEDRGVDSLVIQPGGKLLIAGCASGAIKMWDTQSWKEVRSLGPKSGAIRGLAISPDGKLLASAGPDGQKGETDPDFGIILWEVATGRQLQKLTLDPPSLGTSVLTFTPDGANALVGQDRTIRIWNVKSGKVKEVNLRGPIRTLGAMALRPDGGRIVTGIYEPMIRVWDTQTWQAVRQWDAHDKERAPRRAVMAVRYSPDGKYLLSGGLDQMVCIWEASTGRRLLEIKAEARRTGWVTDVTMSSDGKLLAATNFLGTASIWRISRKPKAVDAAPR